MAGRPWLATQVLYSNIFCGPLLKSKILKLSTFLCLFTANAALPEAMVELPEQKQQRGKAMPTPASMFSRGRERNPGCQRR
jgi:hypothetical protein